MSNKTISEVELKMNMWNRLNAKLNESGNPEVWIKEFDLIADELIKVGVKFGVDKARKTWVKRKKHELKRAKKAGEAQALEWVEEELMSDIEYLAIGSQQYVNGRNELRRQQRKIFDKLKQKTNTK